MNLNKNMRPLFIGGFPSSGTDLVKSILNVHPGVQLRGEMPFLMRALRRADFAPRNKLSEKEANKFLKIIRKNDDYNALGMEEFDYEAFAGSTPREILRKIHVPEKDTTLQYWGNKTPQNTEDFVNLQWYFPELKFVFVVRDIRDVALSWQSKWGKNLYGCAEKWRTRMLNFLGNIQGAVIQVHRLRFEDLLNNTETELRRLCKSLEIPFNDRLLNHHKYTGEQDGKRNYGKPIKPENKAKWKTSLNENEIIRIEQIAGPALKKFGYELKYDPDFKPLTRLGVAWSYLYDGFARILVGNRSATKNNIIERIQTLVKSLFRLMQRKL